MDNFIAEYVKQSPGAQTVLAISLAVLGFVLVNTISHAIQESLNERRRSRALVKASLAPVLSAASDLISRLCEILVYQRKSMLIDLSSDFHPDVMAVPANSLDRLQSTAYRLLRFLALSHHFREVTANTPLFSFLRRTYYFLERKIPTSLKGGFYHITLITREEQEFLAAEVCDIESSVSIERLNIGRFVRLVQADKIDKNIFSIACDALIMNPAPIAGRANVDHNDENWRRLLAWAHIAVYLIDFFQDLGDSPRWEEHRIMLVALIRQWNKGDTNPKYIYQRGDLETSCYLDTYSERLCWGHPLYWFERLMPGGGDFGSLRGKYRRRIKRSILDSRGRRYEATHHRKRLLNKGLAIEGGRKKHDIIYADSLASVHESVLHFLYAEGEITPSY